MTGLSFYRQKRFDGGVRMGIESGASILFEIFEHGPPELEDEAMGSALQWFIDMNFRGDGLPERRDQVLPWLEDRAPAIQSRLLEFARTIEAGLDDELPIRSLDYPLGDQGTRMQLVCSVIRRLTRKDFAKVLAECSREFVDYLHVLHKSETISLSGAL